MFSADIQQQNIQCIQIFLWGGKSVASIAKDANCCNYWPAAFHILRFINCYFVHFLTFHVLLRRLSAFEKPICPILHTKELT